MNIQFDKSVNYFFKKIQCSTVERVLLTFGTEGITLAQLDRDHIKYMEAFLSGKDNCFVKYEVEEPFELPLFRFGVFVDMISSFDGIVDLKKEGNKLLLSSVSTTGNKVCEYVLCAREVIEEVTGKKWSLPFDSFQNKVSLSVNFAKGLLRNVDILNDQMISVSFKEGNINCAVGRSGESRIVETEKCASQVKDCEFNMMSSLFKEIVNSFSSDKFVLAFSDEQKKPFAIVEEAPAFKMVNYLFPLTIAK